jgi:hypothetical protein
MVFLLFLFFRVRPWWYKRQSGQHNRAWGQTHWRFWWMCGMCKLQSLYIFFRLLISRQAVGRCDCNIGQSINQISHTTNLCRPDTVPIKCPSGSWKLKFSIRLDTTRWLTDSYVFPPNQGSWQLNWPNLIANYSNPRWFDKLIFCNPLFSSIWHEKS